MTKGGPIFVILALVIGVALGYLYGTSGSDSDTSSEQASDVLEEAIQEDIANKANPFAQQDDGEGYQNPFSDENFNPFSQ